MMKLYRSIAIILLSTGAVFAGGNEGKIKIELTGALALGNAGASVVARTPAQTVEEGTGTSFPFGLNFLFLAIDRKKISFYPELGLTYNTAKVVFTKKDGTDSQEHRYVLDFLDITLGVRGGYWVSQTFQIYVRGGLFLGIPLGDGTETILTEQDIPLKTALGYVAGLGIEFRINRSMGIGLGACYKYDFLEVYKGDYINLFYGAINATLALNYSF